jgi:hypothetical protein
MVRSSRVDHPPVSGVPVAGATVFLARQRCPLHIGFWAGWSQNLHAGSRVSISILRYTGFVVPTLSPIGYQ